MDDEALDHFMKSLGVVFAHGADAAVGAWRTNGGRRITAVAREQDMDFIEIDETSGPDGFQVNVPGMDSAKAAILWRDLTRDRAAKSARYRERNGGVGSLIYLNKSMLRSTVAAAFPRHQGPMDITRLTDVFIEQVRNHEKAHERDTFMRQPHDRRFRAEKWFYSLFPVLERNREERFADVFGLVKTIVTAGLTEAEFAQLCGLVLEFREKRNLYDYMTQDAIRQLRLQAPAIFVNLRGARDQDTQCVAIASAVTQHTRPSRGAMLRLRAKNEQTAACAAF